LATLKVIDVLDRASIILQDESHVRFPNAELLKFFNDAQREVILQRPDASITNATLALANGAKQALPANALRLIEVIRNTGGQSVTQVDRQLLDDVQPDWYTAVSGARKIEHYVYDSIDPKVFYVYPNAVSGTHSLEIVYSASLADIAIGNFSSDTTTISLDDTYGNALLDYVLYRSYQKDAEYSGNVEKSMMHYQRFAAALGIKSQADAATTPYPEAAA
tara:strand:- start:533 stop:1192 length:660 start_codon:yes stop_codon:yes gene_type:complete